MNEQQKQVQQLNEQLAALKVRLFDAQEAAGNLQAFQSQFFGILAKLLNIAEGKQQDPNAYLEAVQTLVTGELTVEPVIVQSDKIPAVEGMLAD